MSPWSTVGRARRMQNGDGIRIEITAGPLAGVYWMTAAAVRLIEGRRSASFGTINENGIFVPAGNVDQSVSGKMITFRPDLFPVAPGYLRDRLKGDGAEWQIPAKDMLAHYKRRDPAWVAVVAPDEVLARWGLLQAAPEAIAQ